MITSKAEIEPGAWVMATGSDVDYQCVGFVLKLDHFFSEVLVHITQCEDVPALVGHQKTFPLRNVRPMRSRRANTREEIMALADIALAAGDKQWFMELTEKLSAAK